MKRIIFISVIIVLMLGYSCGNKSSSSSKNYEENKLSLEEQEKSDPLKFLSTDGTYRGSLLGGKMVLNGTITNNATMATFKDVTLQVHFYSKTETEIGSNSYIVYDRFPPSQKKEFKSKIEVPDGTKSIGWDIITAEVE